MTKVNTATRHPPPDDTPVLIDTSIARIVIASPLSVVVPTYREVENLPFLIARLGRIRQAHKIELEMIIVDDNSRDGTDTYIRDNAPPWVRLIVRTEERGLSSAVLRGCAEAAHPIIIVMDADLSHPPERIPQLVLALAAGQEMVIGSRFVNGGSTDDAWGIFRWLNSKVATLLARPITRVSDPMSGYFAIRRSTVQQAASLNPIGYKIALELIVKCNVNNVGEVPIHFTDRVRGKSKLSLREQINYLKHIRRLYIHRFGWRSDLAHFLVVGASGVVVNLAVLTGALAAGLAEPLAIGAGIVVSVATNFVLNRKYSFAGARQGNALHQFVGFAAASGVAAALNFTVAMLSLNAFPGLKPQMAALLGIAAGTSINFLANRFVVFRRSKTVRNK